MLPFDLVNMRLHTVRDAASRHAVCNDGTPAKYYFRDCPRPADECNGWSSDWIVVFTGGDSADLCYDAMSCAARNASGARSNQTSSSGLNATLLSPGGIFSYGGEENPNFYGCRTVYVPYCSSDAWLGNASSGGIEFRGRAVALAVMQDLASTTFSPQATPTPLGPGPSRTRLDHADSLTIVGGAGIVSMLTGHDGGALAASVPARVRRKLKVICDGCAIADVAPLVSVDKQPCTSAADCPPATVLQRGLQLWRTTSRATVAPGATPAWRALLADALLPAVHLPLLVQAPLYDATQLAQNRAWPATAARAGYIRAFGARMHATLRQARPHSGRFVFGSACSPARPDLLRDADGFFCRPVRCVLQRDNSTARLRLSAMASMFLRDPEFAPACVDDCGALDCNEYCVKPSCWGGAVP